MSTLFFCQATEQILAIIQPCVNCQVQPVYEHVAHSDGLTYHRLICPVCRRTTVGWHPLLVVAEIGWSMINA